MLLSSWPWPFTAAHGPSPRPRWSAERELPGEPSIQPALRLLHVLERGRRGARPADVMRTSTSRRTPVRASLLLLGVGLLPACTDSEDVLDGPPPTPPGTQTNNVLDRAEALGLSTFVELGSLSSFEVDLRDAFSITVFAPDDAAFASLGALVWSPSASHPILPAMLSVFLICLLYLFLFKLLDLSKMLHRFL